MSESNDKCAFSAPQISGAFACAMGRSVVRRGGAEVACTSADSQQRCARLFELLKTAALTHFGMEDDLLSLPHSVMLKVQYGGLLGLQNLLADNKEQIDDIDGLVTRLLERFQDLEKIPCADVAPDIAAYKMARRRRSKQT